MTGLSLTNCHVVDLEKEIVIEDASILVDSEGVIRRISSLEEGATTSLDMQGSYIVSGLFNLHNNLSMVFPFKDTDVNEREAVTVLRCYSRALKALRAGVTTLRTVGEMHRVDLALRKMINEGWIQGPRIFAGGKAIGSVGGHGSGFGQIEATGPSQFMEAAINELSLGADHLKIFISGGIAKKEEAFEESQMTSEEVAAVVRAASSKGTYVAAHSGGSGPIMMAAEAGVKSFEHAYVLSREGARVVRERGARIVPTLSVTRSPDWMRENGFEEWTIEKAVSAGDTHMGSIRNAVEEGVRILNGTDMPPGDSNGGVNATVREMEFMVEAGLDAKEALRASTLYCAELIGASDKLGLVKEGYLADLVAVVSNPMSDVRAMRNIKFVMKGGQVIRNDLNRKS